MVRLGELNPNNWAPLLALRDKLRAGGGHSTSRWGEGIQGDTTDSRPRTQPAPSAQRHGVAPHTLGDGDLVVSEDVRPTPGSNVVTHIRHPKYRPATKQQRQQVLDLYRAGLPVREIAQQAGVNRSSINRMCRDAGLSRKPQGSDAQRRQARALYAQGSTLAQVAREVGFSRSTIQRWLADSNDDAPSSRNQIDAR